MDDLDLARLAEYLHLTPDQVAKMAMRGRIPGRRVGREWRFSEAEIHHWLEDRIGASDLEGLEKVQQVLDRAAGEIQDRPIHELCTVETAVVPLTARTRGSVIRSMCELAAKSGLLWDPKAMAEAVAAREQMHPTALDCGVALLHPRRPQTSILADSVIAMAVCRSAIPFSDSGQLTDIFFLICSYDDAAHLRILAQLSRLIADSDLLDRLRAADSAKDAWAALKDAEERGARSENRHRFRMRAKVFQEGMRMIGTLIWVGDTSAAEFGGAVEFCLLHVSQIAFRRDCAEALARPASDVHWIIHAHRRRDEADTDRVARQCAASESLHLLGSLVQGHQHSIGPAAVDWHQWDQVLPSWLGLAPATRPKCRTIVVVAASLAIAEPLLELAESYGATAIWSRHAGDHSVRNVDAVWWDDSVAQPAAAHQWRLRTKLFARRGRPVEHAWVTHSPRIDDHQNALTGGVRVIAAKPYGISQLVTMLEQQTPVLRARAA